MEKYEFRFIVGSRFLYGQDVLDTVDSRAREMTEELLVKDLVWKLK